MRLKDVMSGFCQHIVKLFMYDEVQFKSESELQNKLICFLDTVISKDEF